MSFIMYVLGRAKRGETAPDWIHQEFGSRQHSFRLREINALSDERTLRTTREDLEDARSVASKAQYFLNPARSMPRLASSLFMNVFQTNPVRTFSAINSVIPVSIPITSLSYQFFSGLNAFTKPYLLQAEGYRSLIVRSTRITGCGRKGKDPPVALGTTVPSIGPTAGGPPQIT